MCVGFHHCSEKCLKSIFTLKSGVNTSYSVEVSISGKIKQRSSFSSVYSVLRLVVRNM